jgi:hypothetical protein
MPSTYDGRAILPQKQPGGVQKNVTAKKTQMTIPTAAKANATSAKPVYTSARFAGGSVAKCQRLFARANASPMTVAHPAMNTTAKTIWMAFTSPCG